MWLTGDNVLTLFCITGGVIIAGVGLYRAGIDHPLSFAVIANLAILVVFNVDVVGLDRNGTRTTMPLLALGIVLLVTATTWRLPARVAAGDGLTTSPAGPPPRA